MKRNCLLYKNVLTYDTVQVILRSKALFIQQQHKMQIIMTSLVDKTTSLDKNQKMKLEYLINKSM